MSALVGRIQSLDWDQVDSSNVAAVAYDKDFRRLFVQYKNGQVVAYEDIPVSVWKAMMNAESIGEFVYDDIRGANGKRADKKRGIPAPNVDYIYPYRSLGKQTIPTNNG